MEYSVSKAIILGEGSCGNCGHITKTHDYIYLADFGEEFPDLFTACPECERPLSIPKKVQHHYIGEQIDLEPDSMDEFMKASKVGIAIITDLGL